MTHHYNHMLAQIYMKLPRDVRHEFLMNVANDRPLMEIHGLDYTASDCYTQLKEKLESIIAGELFEKPELCKPVLIGNDAYCLHWVSMQKKGEDCFYLNLDRTVFSRHKKYPHVGCNYDHKAVEKYWRPTVRKKRQVAKWARRVPKK